MAYQARIAVPSPSFQRAHDINPAWVSFAIVVGRSSDSEASFGCAIFPRFVLVLLSLRSEREATLLVWFGPLPDYLGSSDSWIHIKSLKWSNINTLFIPFLHLVRSSVLRRHYQCHNKQAPSCGEETLKSHRGVKVALARS